MKEYDWNMLQKFLDLGDTVTVGIKEDWFWTAEELTQESVDKKLIAGIAGSIWGTPSVDLGPAMIDCYIEKE